MNKAPFSYQYCPGQIRHPCQFLNTVKWNINAKMYYFLLQIDKVLPGPQNNKNNSS